MGLTEAKARERGHQVQVGKFPFAALGRAQTYGDTEGFVKIVADERYGEILGVHILGAVASDMIAEATMAMHLEATVEDLAATIHAHPTWPEATAEAALATRGLALHLLKPRERRATASYVPRGIQQSRLLEPLLGQPEECSKGATADRRPAPPLPPPPRRPPR